MGLRLISTLTLVTAFSLGLRVVRYTQGVHTPPPAPPEQITVPSLRAIPSPGTNGTKRGQSGTQTIVWRAAPSEAPLLDAMRDSPPVTARVYTGSDFPVFVSLARVTTINSLRAPQQYLLDTDGRTTQFSGSVPRKKGQLPAYMFQILQGRSDLIFQMHWAQPIGGDPMPDPLDAPGGVASALLLHRPLVICDVWIPVRVGTNGQMMEETLIAFAKAIDSHIASLPP